MKKRNMLHILSMKRRVRIDAAVLAVMAAVTLLSVSCGNSGPDRSEHGATYTYPDNPANALRSFLKADTTKRSLPFEVGDIVQTEWDGEARIEFAIRLTDSPENACVVSFTTKNTSDASLDGHDNPSFTLAFRDPDKPRDMVAVLTSVLLYLSPDLSLEEAERLAVRQDDTLTIDGYSTPKDIGGYQVQAHYTNPHVFFTTENFTAKLGVTVTSLKQIWGGGIDMGQCAKLTSPDELEVLNRQSAIAENDTQTPEVVYSDFIVRDWWEHEDTVHGDRETRLTVEGQNRKQYELRLDPAKTPYEFGIGEKYTLFIVPSLYGARIVYAVQLDA